MKLNTKNKILYGSISVVLISGIIAFSTPHMAYRLNAGSTTPFIMTLDDNNSPDSFTDEEATKVLYGGTVTLNYTGASASLNSGHVRLSIGGTITKEEATYDIKSITVTYTGTNNSLVFESDYDDTYAGTHFITYLGSGTTYQVGGNYWRIISKDATNDIESIVLTYGCSASAMLSSTTLTSIDGFKQMYLEKHDDGTTYGKTYVVLEGYYSNGALNPTDVYLTASNVANFNPVAEYIEYRTTTDFVAYFNLTRWYSEHASHVATVLWQDITLQFKYKGDNLGHIGSDHIGGAFYVDQNLVFNIWEYDNKVSLSYGKHITDFDHDNTDGRLWDSAITVDTTNATFTLTFKIQPANAHEIDLFKQSLAVYVDVYGDHYIYPTGVTSSQVTGTYPRTKLYLTYPLADFAAIGNADYWIHLYFNGVAWNDGDGNFRIKGAQNNAVIQSAFQHGGHIYSLKYDEWNHGTPVITVS